MFIFSNLATSLDGKIAPVKPRLFLLGTEHDRKHMIKLRSEADAILFGASTLRSWRRLCRTPGLPKNRLEPANIVLSSRLEGLSTRWPFFCAEGPARILIVSAKASTRRIREFEKSSEIIQLASPTRRKPIALQIIQKLEARGVRRLLIEGGGSIMALFSEHNLINEYHVTLTPRILGGKLAPTLVDGDGMSGPSSIQLKLRQCRVIGDEIYVVYGRS